MDEILKDHHAAIVAAVGARMRGDEDMAGVAGQRRLSESDLSAQVVGFWLEAIRTDLALNSTDAMEQNLEWLPRLRKGHDLHFGDAAVARCFALLSVEIEARLESGEHRAEYAGYRARVEGLIDRAFPGAGGQ